MDDDALRASMSECMSTVSDSLGVLAGALGTSAAAVTAYTRGVLTAKDIQDRTDMQTARRVSEALDKTLVAEIIRLQQNEPADEVRGAAELYSQSLVAFRQAAAIAMTWSSSWQTQLEAPDVGEWLDSAPVPGADDGRGELSQRYIEAMEEATLRYEQAGQALTQAALLKAGEQDA